MSVRPPQTIPPQSNSPTISSNEATGLLNRATKSDMSSPSTRWANVNAPTPKSMGHVPGMGQGGLDIFTYLPSFDICHFYEEQFDFLNLHCGAFTWLVSQSFSQTKQLLSQGPSRKLRGPQEQIATPFISQYKRILGTIPKSRFTDSWPSSPPTGNKHDVDGKLTAAANLENCAIFLVAEQVRFCCNLPECSLATSIC